MPSYEYKSLPVKGASEPPLSRLSLRWQFLTNISGTDSAVEALSFQVLNKNYCSVAQNNLKDLQGYVDAYAGIFPLESNFHLVKSGLNPFGLDVSDFSYIAAHEFHVKALQMTSQQRQDLHVLILGAGGGVMTMAMRNGPT